MKISLLLLYHDSSENTTKQALFETFFGTIKHIKVIDIAHVNKKYDRGVRYVCQ